MRLEESHDRCHKVPRQIDNCQECDSADSNLILEQNFDILQQTGMLSSSLGSLKLGTLLQAPLQIPRDECYDEQRSEHYTRSKHLHGCHIRLSTHEQVRQRLYPSVEHAIGLAGMPRSKKHTEQQDAHGTYAPRHLRETDITTAVVHLRTFGDICPRRRHAYADRYTREQKSRKQHGKVSGAHHQQHAEHIYEQVVSKDELTSVLVRQKSSDDCTNSRTEAVGTDEIQPPERDFAQTKVVLPQRQSAGAGNDSTGIEIIVERDRQSALQTTTFTHIICKLYLLGY